MTSQTQTFSSIPDFVAEIQRLHTVIDSVTNHTDRDAAYDELEKVENAMIAFRAEKRKSHDKDRLAAELTELEAFAVAHRYDSIEEMLEAHGLIRKPDVKTGTAAANGTKAKNKRTAKPTGMPQVFKYVREVSGKVDLTDGGMRLSEKMKSAGGYRLATDTETKTMQTTLADWIEKNPKQ